MHSNRISIPKLVSIATLGTLVPGAWPLRRNKKNLAMTLASISIIAYIGYEFFALRSPAPMKIFRALFFTGFFISGLEASLFAIRNPIAVTTIPSKEIKRLVLQLGVAQWLIFSTFFLVDHSRSYSITSNSMSPNLFKGDSVMVDLNYGKKQKPGKGDVVAFRSSTDPSVVQILRVVSWGSDFIEIKDKRVIINQQPLEQQPVAGDVSIRREMNYLSSYLIAIDPLISPSTGFSGIDVPRDQYFVMGDNRDHVKDSRVFGLIRLKNILGKVVYSY